MSWVREKPLGLLIDDERFVPKCLEMIQQEHLQGQFEWVIVRNLEQLQDFAQSPSWPPAIILWDHDLGDYAPDGTELNGKYCAIWLLDYCHDNNLPFPAVNLVHSRNPYGSGIDSYIQNAFQEGFVYAAS